MVFKKGNQINKGRSPSEYNRLCSSITHKGNKWALGYKHTEETKRKISILHKGKVISKEIREKMSLVQMGHKGYFLGCKHTEESKRKIGLIHKGRKNTEESKLRMSKARVGKYCGEKSPVWGGGKSFEPYGLDFNKELRNKIRKRDNYTCQECNYPENKLKSKLSVHHIDYNKQNNKESNLISLCKSCHSQTNFNREDWTNYFNKEKAF